MVLKTGGKRVRAVLHSSKGGKRKSWKHVGAKATRSDGSYQLVAVASGHANIADQNIRH
jgi:hypothetical protein